MPHRPKIVGSKTRAADRKPKAKRRLQRDEVGGQRTVKVTLTEAPNGAKSTRDPSTNIVITSIVREMRFSLVVRH